MITNKDTLKLAYSAKGEGIIWKIILDERKEIVVWECRTKDKKVSFNAYDFKTNQVLLNNFNFEADWELSINTVIDGILYFNGHESDFSPVQKGVIAYDLCSNKILWQDFSIGAQVFTLEGLVVFDSKILPRKFRLVNYTNGHKIKDIPTTAVKTLKSLGNEITLPKMNESAEMLEVHYHLLYQDLSITSYYEKTNGVVNQHIKVEKNGEILLAEIMNRDIQKISFDTFFVWHNLLFYISNKTEIVSYFV